MSADSGKFIEFLLTAILDTLNEIADTVQVDEQVTEQVNRLIEVMSEKEYSTKELMTLVGLLPSAAVKPLALAMGI